MQIFSDKIPIPVGMELEEWEERKRNLRRKAWMKFLKAILITIITMEFCVWFVGGYEKLQPKKLNELQVISGTFYYGGAKRTAIGIKNSITDQTVIFDSWLGNFPSLRTFKGQPSTAWYYYGQAGRRYVYQLEVDGVLVFNLENANQNLDRDTRVKEETSLIARVVGGICILCCWWDIRRRYREWLSQES